MDTLNEAFRPGNKYSTHNFLCNPFINTVYKNKDPAFAWVKFVRRRETYIHKEKGAGAPAELLRAGDTSTTTRGRYCRVDLTVFTTVAAWLPLLGGLPAAGAVAGVGARRHRGRGVRADVRGVLPTEVIDHVARSRRRTSHGILLSEGTR